MAGQLGVVSGTALPLILARRLQEGDPTGCLRRALGHFPSPELAKGIVKKYFVDGGKPSDKPYRSVPMFSAAPGKELLRLTVVSNFVEVFLAKEGHSGIVGINYLEKIQMPNLSSLYGAMLAGVDYVLMGAGVPRKIPGIMDELTGHGDVSLRLNAEGVSRDRDHRSRFSPSEILEKGLPSLKRPKFLPIIASAILAITLAKKASGQVDGFIVEGPTAGGHNAPPRGATVLDAKGEPVYGPKDDVDLGKIRELGLPFWLAGSYGTPEKLRSALDAGAQGVQVGTAFALCQESALADSVKQELLARVVAGTTEVRTDTVASPTGFPFKVASLENSLSNPMCYADRPRVCDLGYLRHPYEKDDGSLGYRCPSEPVDDYVRKGRNIEDTVGRKCLCNGLMANIGHPQLQKTGYREQPLVTIGDDVKDLTRLMNNGNTSYTAADVIRHLLGE